MEQEGVARVKMFLVITVAYLIFWGPLFLVTLVNWSWEWKDAKKSMSHEVKAKSNLQSTFFLIPRSLFMWPLSTPLSTHFSLLSSTRVAGGYPALKKFSHKHRRATLDLLCCNFSQYSAREGAVTSNTEEDRWCAHNVRRSQDKEFKVTTSAQYNIFPEICWEKTFDCNYLVSSQFPHSETGSELDYELEKGLNSTMPSNKGPEHARGQM